MNGYKNLNFKIAFSGIMLGCVLLFQYLEKFMPFGATFVKINLSLIFIMATVYIAGVKWGVLLLILRFVIGPAIGSSAGYTSIGFWSQFILFDFGLIYLIIFYSSDLILRKYIGVTNLITRVSTAAVLTTLIVSLVGSFLNSTFFTPGYFAIMNNHNDLSLGKAKETYANVTPFYFGIKDYWAGTLTVYIVSNLVKYTIISILFIFLWRAIKHFVNPKHRTSKNSL